MSNRTPFNDFTFYEIPDPYDVPEAKPRWRRWITPAFALIMVVILLGGSLYAALRPYLFPPSTDVFSAVLTGVSAHENCDNAPQTTPRGSLTPTRNLCVCGRTFTENETRVNFQLRLRNATGHTIETQSFNRQETGKFCQEFSLDRQLGNGNYRVEIASRLRTQPIAWIRFSVFQPNSSVFVVPD